MEKVKKSFSIKPFAVVLAFFIILLSLTYDTFAWLSVFKTKTHNIISSNFVVQPDVYFLQSNGNKVAASRDDKGFYIVNISNSSAVDFISKLRVDIRYRGVTKSYLRVYFSDMWYTKIDTPYGIEDTVFLKEGTRYRSNAADWYDNRYFDRCFYYSGGTMSEKGMVYSANIGAEVILPFITGVDEVSTIEDGVLKLEVQAEAVQFNRIEAFWGITELPS